MLKCILFSSSLGRKIGMFRLLIPAEVYTYREYNIFLFTEIMYRLHDRSATSREVYAKQKDKF